MAETDHKTPEIFAEPVYVFTEDAYGELRYVEECMFLISLLIRERKEEPLVPMTLWTSFFHIMGSHLRSTLNTAPWYEGV